MPTTDPTLRKTTADRDTRCRSCWARIRIGSPVVVDTDQAVFHADCPAKFYGFPEFHRLREDGVVPEDLTERDDYYPHRHEAGFRHRRR